jgi:hypothetical protein
MQTHTSLMKGTNSVIQQHILYSARAKNTFRSNVSWNWNKRVEDVAVHMCGFSQDTFVRWEMNEITDLRTNRVRLRVRDAVTWTRAQADLLVAAWGQAFLLHLQIKHSLYFRFCLDYCNHPTAKNTMLPIYLVTTVNHLPKFSYDAETKRCGRVNITASCTEGPGFEYRPENLLSWVRGFLPLLCPSMNFWCATLK